MSEYRPDNWTIIGFEGNFKVFGSWSGGYLDGDSWRLSSGIKSIQDDGDNWIIHNHSGSRYICNKNGEGVVGASNSATLNSILAIDGAENSTIDNLMEEE